MMCKLFNKNEIKDREGNMKYIQQEKQRKFYKIYVNWKANIILTWNNFFFKI